MIRFNVTGHGARDVMNARVKKKYANVTKEVLQLFADTCDECQTKKRGRKVRLLLHGLSEDNLIVNCLPVRLSMFVIRGSTGN